MEERLIKSFGDLLSEQYGSNFTSDWAVEQFRNELVKGMASGPGVGSFGDMNPLMLQNLDDTMTSVLFDEDHLKFFATLPRVPSVNLNYQYNKRLSYGGGRRAPGFTEGGAPRGGTSRYERDSAIIRFMGVKRGLTHPLMRIGELGGSQVDPVAEENRNGTLELLEELERTIFFGDSLITDNSGFTVNYDGIRKQITNSPVAAKGNYVDLQGDYLTLEKLEDFSKLLIKNYFVKNFKSLQCLASADVVSDFSKQRLNIDRHEVQQGRINPQMAGLPFKGYSSTFGDIPIASHLFFERVLGDAPLSEQAEKGAPSTPVTISAAAVTDTTSKQKAATVYYTVAAFNESGESMPLVAGTNVAVVAGQRVDLTITQVTGNISYRVYRGVASDGSDAKWIGDIADSGAGTTVFADRNFKVPGTGTCLIWLNDEETVAVPQFMPLLRWPLAIVDTSINWLLLLYHTVVVKAPQRMILVENIGPLK